MHLLSLADWSAARIESALDLARRMKAAPEKFRASLRGRILLALYERPSLRTRVSFEAAMLRLGGRPITVDAASTPWGIGKETVGDVARTASGYADVLVVRLARHEDLSIAAAASRVPVINALTDREHPCQALGDLLTLREKFGRLKGIRIAYLGDGRTNVAHSLLDACSRTGVSMTIGCPESPEYAPDPVILARAVAAARGTGAEMAVVHRPREAVAGADAVYTDSWMSYHIPPAERNRRIRELRAFRVTSALLAAANPAAPFMHCLPALRGMEQTAEVLDGPRSIVFDQADNRLHSAMAVLLAVMRAGAAPGAPGPGPRKITRREG